MAVKELVLEGSYSKVGLMLIMYHHASGQEAIISKNNQTNVCAFPTVRITRDIVLMALQGTMRTEAP